MKPRLIPLTLAWLILSAAWLPMAHREIADCIMWQRNVAFASRIPPWEWPAALAKAPALETIRRWNPATVALSRLGHLDGWKTDREKSTENAIIDRYVEEGMPEVRGSPPREPWRYYMYCLRRRTLHGKLDADYAILWRQIDPDNGIWPLLYANDAFFYEREDSSSHYTKPEDPAYFDKIASLKVAAHSHFIDDFQEQIAAAMMHPDAQPPQEWMDFRSIGVPETPRPFDSLGYGMPIESELGRLDRLGDRKEMAEILRTAFQLSILMERRHPGSIRGNFYRSLANPAKTHGLIKEMAFAKELDDLGSYALLPEDPADPWSALQAFQERAPYQMGFALFLARLLLVAIGGLLLLVSLLLLMRALLVRPPDLAEEQAENSIAHAGKDRARFIAGTLAIATPIALLIALALRPYAMGAVAPEISLIAIAAAGACQIIALAQSLAERKETSIYGEGSSSSTSRLFRIASPFRLLCWLTSVPLLFVPSGLMLLSEALQYLSCFLSALVLAWTVLRVCRPARDHHHARLLWQRTRAILPPLLVAIALLLSLAFIAHRAERHVLSGPPEEVRARPAMRQAQMAAHAAALRQIEQHFARDFPEGE